MSPTIRRATHDDMEVVDGIMRHPDVLPGVLEGTGATEADLPELETWFDRAIFLVAEDETTGEPGAVVIFDPIGDRVMDMHLCLLKPMRGPVIGDEVIKGAVRWAFTHTKTQRVHASFVSTKRRLADKLERCGFCHSWPTTKSCFMEAYWEQWVMSDRRNHTLGAAVYARSGIEPRPWDSGLVAAVGHLDAAAREGCVCVERFNLLARARRWPAAMLKVHAISDDGGVESSITVGPVSIKVTLDPRIAMEV